MTYYSLFLAPDAVQVAVIENVEAPNRQSDFPSLALDLSNDDKRIGVLLGTFLQFLSPAHHILVEADDAGVARRAWVEPIERK